MRRHTTRWLTSSILLVGIVACATAARSTTHTSATRNVIELGELDSAVAPNLLEVVRQLRPEWLQRSTSGVRSIRSGSAGANGDQLNVYVDEVRHAGTSVLAQFNPNGVTGIRYYTASEAQIRFGEGNTAGVIHVVTRIAVHP